MTISCTAVRATRFESVWDEPLADQVTAVVGHLVRGPVLAHLGAAAVAAVSQLVAEPGGGRKGHPPILVHGNSSIWVRLMKSAQLFVGIWHDISIAKGLFQVVKISPPDCVIRNRGQH